MSNSPEKISKAQVENYSCHDLLTEEELVVFLRIPEVSNSKDFHNVIEHLKRFRDLPRIHICNKALYPKEAIRKWIEEKTIMGK